MSRPPLPLRPPNYRPPDAYYTNEEPTVFDRRPDLMQLPTFGAAWALAIRSNA